MKLEDEIRQALEAHSGPVHPYNIRWWVESDRREREDDTPLQDIETFKRVMRYMSDVKSIKIDKVWYRELKNAGFKKRTARWHFQCMLHLITVRLTRRILCLNAKRKVLLTQLRAKKEAIVSLLTRLK